MPIALDIPQAGCVVLTQVFLAITACGAIAVPISLRWSIPETVAALKDVAASLVFVDADILSNYHSALSGYRCIVLDFQAHAKQSRKDAIVRQSAGPSCMQDLIQEHMGAHLQLQAPADGAALICFTSGTSGPPKGGGISQTALHSRCLHCSRTHSWNSPSAGQTSCWCQVSTCSL